MAIEFQGTYWHMDNRIYEAIDYNKSTHMTAEETWKRDEVKANIYLENGIDLITIWESDWNDNKEVIKEQILKLLEENNNEY